MQENIAVYEALRAHILEKENQIANETVYMYVTYFALLAVGSIWNSWISLVPFFSLIVFQSMINSDQWSITKASTYIKVFFEEPYKNIHWESLHHDTFCMSVLNEKLNKTVGWYISKWGATTLSFLSFLSILFPELHEANYNFYGIPSFSTVRIVIAAILCVITIYVNKQYFPVRNEKNGNLQLENAIRAFYNNSQTLD